MPLRKQLAFFSLLTLILPWAGYRYVREMETVLRGGLEQSLSERAQTVAGALQRQRLTAELTAEGASASAASVQSLPGRIIYATLLRAAPDIDGSAADWSSASEIVAELDDAVSYRAGVFGASVYLSVDVRDDSVVYQARPGEPPYGDRVVLQLGSDPELWRIFATAAPGRVRAQATELPLLAASGDFDDRIQAAWLATQQGYSIEVRVPRGLAQRALGIAIVDVDRPTDGTTAIDDAQAFGVTLISSWADSAARDGSLVVQSAALRSALEQFADAANRYTVVGTDGWIRASAGAIDGAPGRQPARSLTGDLIRYLLQTDDPDDSGLEAPAGRINDAELLGAGGPAAATAGDAVKWFRGDLDNSARVIASVPLRHDGTLVGALLLEQASERVLTATNQAVLSLLSTTFAASLVALLGMLGFATWLSLRVSRLARAAGDALGPRGQIATQLPGRTAQDEIGELSRSFENLLERLNEYTSYLRTLTSKLSHELRTPLAVVSTSLDNLEQARDEEATQYLRRLRDGANRLDAILGAMSEATRMEQAIADAQPVRFDACVVVRSCADAYRDVYASHEIVCEIAPAQVWIDGSAELLAQLLDKLVDNAASFSAPGSSIRIRLDADAHEAMLSVANPGSSLPPQMREQLFDSLVSVRDDRGDRPHLGLGLYVARLIAEFHGGRISADNVSFAGAPRANEPGSSGPVGEAVVSSGVEFAVRMPKLTGD